MITSICRSFFVVTSQLPWGQKRLWILRLGMVVWSDGAGEILALGLWLSHGIPIPRMTAIWRHTMACHIFRHIMTHHDTSKWPWKCGVRHWICVLVTASQGGLFKAKTTWSKFSMARMLLNSYSFNMFQSLWIAKKIPLSWCNWWYHGSKSIWFPAASSLSIIH